MNNLSYEHEIVAYIKMHPAAVLGTVDKNGHPAGAAVYIWAASAEQVYFITKTETEKFKNLPHNKKVSLTIVDPLENSTLQATGHAKVETNVPMIELVMEKMAQIHAKSPDWLPPIAKLHAGAYQVVGVKLDHVRLGRFKNAPVGSPDIFKES